MSEQLLQLGDVAATIEKVDGEGVAELVDVELLTAQALHLLDEMLQSIGC